MGMPDHGRSVDAVLQELRTKLMVTDTMIGMSLQASGEVQRMRAAVAKELEALTAAIPSVRADLDRNA
jgi:hypothetical protein